MAWYDGLEYCVRKSEPLAAHCWLGLGGEAKFFAEPTSMDELVMLVQRCRDESINVRLIGDGSNLLISDKGFDGLVLSLPAAAFGQISVKNESVTAGGAAHLSHVVMTAAREGLSGLEGLVGIPGTVGAALHGNAGNRTSHVGNSTDSVTVMTRSGEIATRTRDELNFSYRESSLDELVIVEATFQLEADNREELIRRIQKTWIVKRADQPTRERRTACLFKDPMGAQAKELIEQAGLAGERVHGISLFPRDYNFVLAGEAATSQDVKSLMEIIQRKVHEKLGVELEPAIQVW